LYDVIDTEGPHLSPHKLNMVPSALTPISSYTNEEMDSDFLEEQKMLKDKLKEEHKAQISSSSRLHAGRSFKSSSLLNSCRLDPSALIESAIRAKEDHMERVQPDYTFSYPSFPGAFARF